MSLNPSNAQAARDHGPVFSNVAGHPDPDKILRAELEAAGIEVFSHECLRNGESEVNTSILGTLGNWGFKRNWYYWVAEGDGLPLVYAKELHESHGREVRVDGNCGCPSPDSRKGFAIGTYHVDTPGGLKALADMLKRVVKEHEESVKPEQA